MIRAEDSDPFVVIESARQPTDAFGRARRVCAGGGARQQIELRLDHGQLGVQVLTAVFRFLGRRNTIAGRTALDGVQNVNILTAKLHPLLDDFRQLLPRPPHERQPFRIFVPPPALAPMKTSLAWGLPEPKTVCFRVRANSGQRRQTETLRAILVKAAAWSWGGMGGADTSLVRGSITTGALAPQTGGTCVIAGDCAWDAVFPLEPSTSSAAGSRSHFACPSPAAGHEISVAMATYRY